MFLEMVKDMPRGRQDSLARMLVPLLVVMAAALVVVGVRMVDDARVADHLERQVERQAATAGVLFLERPVVVPVEGERQVPVLVGGRRGDGLIRVDGDRATLLVRSPEGSFVAVAPAD